MRQILVVLILTGSAHPAVFAATPSELPEKCFETSLKASFPKIEIGERSTLFVKCSSEKSEPTRGQKRPQYRASEIKQLHQAFNKISVCLEIDTRWLFPKLMMESGFHPAIQNPNGDAGIGQLTWKAMKDVDVALPGLQTWVKSQKSPACRWVYSRSQSIKDFWKPVEGKSKCAVMAGSNGAFRNLFYTAAFHRLNRDYVAKEFKKRNISSLLRELDFPMGHESSMQEILLALGYNTGGAVAVKNLEDYLLARLDEKKKNQQGLENPLMKKLLRAPTKNHNLSLEDFDFTLGLHTLHRRTDLISKKLAKDFKKQGREVRADELKKYAQISVRHISASELTFPEWLKIWQSHGGPGYVSNLASYAINLDKKMGAKVCANLASYRL